MILGERHHSGHPRGPASRVTLDDMFRHTLAHRPNALALADPPDRTGVTDGAPRRLTYAQADRAISGVAARLRGFGLPTDAIVALQLPNTVESVVALLGVLRAELIAAPLPLLWRQVDASVALGRIGARALITCRHIGDCDAAELAMHIAAETFTIRFLAAFGGNLPDGIAPLEDVFAEGAAIATPPVERTGHAGDHVAIVTFDVSPQGIVPVARSHTELVAGGLGVQLEALIAPDAAILGALATASFAGIASIIVPWLLVGGTLSLHHPFEPATLAEQLANDRCTVAVVPGPLAARLHDAGLCDATRLKSILAVWRAPERLASGAAWPREAAPLIDVSAFGETGLVALRRASDGKPGSIPIGRLEVPRDARGARHVLDIARGTAGTVVLAGPMVPAFPFPPGIERGEAPRLRIGDDGTIDTGYSCRLTPDKRLTVDGPPAGLVTVGGYRFALNALQGLVGSIDDESTVAALPDTLTGQRLAGTGGDRSAIREALVAQGANPLVVAAFRDRRAAGRASAA